MKRLTSYLAVLIAATGPAWSQRGHGDGMGTGHHGAPMTFPQAKSPNARVGTPMPGTGAHARTPDVGARLSANPGLVTRIQPLLPPGTTATAAASGFKNQGQFLAALHVSKNL